MKVGKCSTNSSLSSPLMDGENGITCREQLNLTIEHLLNFTENLVSYLNLRDIKCVGVPCNFQTTDIAVKLHNKMYLKTTQ
jgi:hypothetical protein